MILSTLHKTTGTTHDLYSLRETIDFFPFINLKMLCSLPSGPIIFIGIYPKTTAQGYSYENIWGFNSLYRAQRRATNFCSEPKICPDCKRYYFFYCASGPKGKTSSLDRAYTLSNGILSKFERKVKSETRPSL